MMLQEYNYNSSFDLNYLFYFSMSFMASIGIYTFSFERRKYFYIPAILTVAGVEVFGFFFPYPFIWGFPLGMAISLVMIIIGSFLVFKENWDTIISAILLGIVTNHACFSLWSIVLINTPLFSNVHDAVQLVSGIFYFAGTLSLIYFFLVRRMVKSGSLQFRQFNQKLYLAVFAALIIVLPSLARLFNLENFITRIYEFIACIAYLFLELYIDIKNNTEIEKNKIESLLKAEEKQRILSEKNAEILNIKAHDLKHQLGLLKGDVSSSKKDIEDMEEAIARYDMLTRTGNKAFDAVIAEYAPSMYEDHVRLSVIADPEAISFLSPSEVYSFFGNAISNAYEASKKEEEDKRYISILLRKNKGYCIFHMENYSSRKPVPNKRGLITSKKDKTEHGYGTKSMLYIANKHNGNLTFGWENEVFTVDAMIPLP